MVAGRRVGGVSINLVTHPLGENEMGVLIVVGLIFVLNNVSGVVCHCDWFILIFLGIQVDVLALCVAFVCLSCC